MVENAKDCRSASRLYATPDRASYAVGFRVVLAASSPPTPELVPIEPGEFIMGSPEGEVGRLDFEGPQTIVRITMGFSMGKYEVTQGEYESVIGSNPSANSFFEGWDRPVDQVSWEDTTNYCALLTIRERKLGRIPLDHEYRLPTEAEWEYACRAGTTTRFSYGNDPGYTALINYAWYDMHTSIRVGENLPNPWGLYDMHGNVREWCQDWFGDYPLGPVTDPVGPETGYQRVYRGGAWHSIARSCRSAYRTSANSEPAFIGQGFRVVLAAGQ